MGKVLKTYQDFKDTVADELEEECGDLMKNYQSLGFEDLDEVQNYIDNEARRRFNGKDSLGSHNSIGIR